MKGVNEQLSKLPFVGQYFPHEKAESTTSGGEESEEEAEEIEPTVPLTAEQKLLAKLPAAMQKLPAQTLRIVMPDGVIISGRLYYPGLQPPPSEEDEEEEGAAEEEESAEGETAPAKPVTQHPLVILLPGVDHTLTVWGDLPAQLVKDGYAVFTPDLRGHGGSNRSRDGQAFGWRLFQAGQWAKMPDDVVRMVRFFKRNPKYPAVNGGRVALIGEKLGANVAIMAAHRNKDAIRALVLISPGRNYKGLDPSNDILDYPHPAYLMAGTADRHAYESTPVLYRLFGKATMKLYPGAAGADMLHNAGIRQAMHSWLLQRFPPSSGAVQPST